jgi:hypothetical protein
MSSFPGSALVTPENAYHVYQSVDGQWTYFVLRKYAPPEREKKDMFSKWYCQVISPVTGKGGSGIGPEKCSI